MIITTAFYDPAARDAKQHDHKAIIVGSLLGSIYYVRYAFIRRCSTQTILDQLYFVDREFRQYTTEVYQGFEANGFQILYKELLAYKARDEGYPITIQERTSIGNKRARIDTLSGFVENGFIRFQQDGKASADMTELLNQLLAFPNGDHDDGPDALYYAYFMAKDKAISYASGNKTEKKEDYERQKRDQYRRYLQTRSQAYR